jgi:predicted hexulose-6-phosphate isomerase
MKETGVMIPSMCLSAHRRFPMGSEDANTRKTAMEIMQKAIYFAVDTGIQNIQLAGYDVYYENGNERTKKYFIEGLKKAVEWAGKAGVMLSIEIMDHEFMNSITKAMEYINELNSPWLKIYPDLGNLSGWGMDIPAELEVGKGHIVAIHVKETKPGIFKRVPFGEGTVPFIEAFEKLSKMNYQGPFLVEMWSDDAEDAIQTINEAIIWVKDKMRQGGIQV